MNEEILKQNIMRRVHFIYRWQRLAGAWSLKAIILALILLLQFYLVSFTDVLTNMMSVGDIRSFYAFWVTAFLDTELIIQGTVLVATLIFVVLVRDLWRQTKRPIWIFKASH